MSQSNMWGSANHKPRTRPVDCFDDYQLHTWVYQRNSSKTILLIANIFRRSPIRLGIDVQHSHGYTRNLVLGLLILFLRHLGYPGGTEMRRSDYCDGYLGTLCTYNISSCKAANEHTRLILNLVKLGLYCIRVKTEIKTVNVRGYPRCTTHLGGFL